MFFMKYASIVKELEKIKKSKTLEEALEKVDQLIEKLSVYRRKDEIDTQVKELLNWYVALWKGRPPEFIGNMRWQENLKRILKKLYLLYWSKGYTLEDIKQEYLNFRTGVWNGKDIKGTYLTRDNSITHFRNVLPALKGSEWTSV